MPTTILPDNGHAASQRIGLQKLMTLGSELDEETPTGLALFDRRGLHQQIHDALETPAFKIAAAGKSGEALKEAVAAAMAVEKVPVEIISVAPSENAEAYAATPYEAVWETRPGSVRERSYFGV